MLPDGRCPPPRGAAAAVRVLLPVGCRDCRTPGLPRRMPVSFVAAGAVGRLLTRKAWPGPQKLDGLPLMHGSGSLGARGHAAARASGCFAPSVFGMARACGSQGRASAVHAGGGKPPVRGPRDACRVDSRTARGVCAFGFQAARAAGRTVSTDAAHRGSQDALCPLVSGRSAPREFRAAGGIVVFTWAFMEKLPIARPGGISCGLRVFRSRS